MNKILSAEQIRDWDADTIAHEPISSLDLMERASLAFVQWFSIHFTSRQRIHVVCGVGNNGGDGLAIARLLRDWGHAVRVYVAGETNRGTSDFQENLQRLKQTDVEIEYLTSVENEPPRADVLIDALFGSGLSRTPEGFFADLIGWMNNAAVMRIAVDIPSGLFADRHSPGPYVHADYTITFQSPKLSFFLPQYAQAVGEFVVVDIHLRKSFLKKVETKHFFIQREDVRALIRPRGKFDHKGTFGHSLIVAGSYGKIGAAVLSARAALRSGSGLATLHIPRCGYTVAQTALPEAMVQTDVLEDSISHVDDIAPYTTVGIGPGLGRLPHTAAMVRDLMQQFRRPMVIDADALNIISENASFKQEIPEGSILTPHPKEFERLVGPWKSDFERLEKQRQFAADHQVIVIVKGGHTAIAMPGGDIFFNTSGNPGMATGGSGDVLTGILTGLLAQGYSPEAGALLGVYLHGLAGDQCSVDLGNAGIIASDLVEHIPVALRSIAR